MTNPASCESDSGYVFEYLADSKSLAIRRADMAKPNAREALQKLIVMLYGARIRDTDIDDFLAMCPADWLFLTVRVEETHGKPGLKVGPADREPGKDSGDNSVITGLDVTRIH